MTHLRHTLGPPPKLCFDRHDASIFWDTNIKSRLIISRREDRFHGEVIVRADVYAIFGLRSGYLNRYRPGAVSSSRTRARSYVCFCNLTRNRRRRIADGFETKYLSLSNLRRFSSINPRPRLRAFRQCASTVVREESTRSLPKRRCAGQWWERWFSLFPDAKSAFLVPITRRPCSQCSTPTVCAATSRGGRVRSLKWRKRSSG